MSEKSHHSHEHGHDKIELDSTSKEILEKLAEKGRESAEKHAEELKENLEDIRAEAHEKAKSASEVLFKREQEAKEPDTPLLVNKDLKNIKYKRTLQSVQKDLKPAERALSKVMHNEKVDAISEVAGKTIARPSGFLAGAITAFVGSSIYLWTTKHYGYEYNFLFFAMLFAAGFALGLLVELGLRMAHRRKA